MTATAKSDHKFVNAKELEDRCEARISASELDDGTLRGAILKTMFGWRCTLIRGHSSPHIAPNDHVWNDS